MAGRARQISLKECYEILNLKKGADLSAVKSAYRRMAFELHPDLNPGNPDASRRFQRLNEAYVALSAMLEREEARKKPSEKQEQKEKTQESASRAEREAQHAYEEQDILRDLLNDPFARRVFEDIYSELGKQKREKEERAAPPPEPEKEEPEKKPEPKPAPPKESKLVKTAPLHEKRTEKGVKGAVQSWLLRQLDEKLTLAFPASTLFPGRKIPLKYRPGLSDEEISIEVTLPKDFAVGKPMRLRGMGRRVGPWKGDLYLTINSK